MRNLNKEFANKVLDESKLLEYGFTKHGEIYTFEKFIYDKKFKIVMELSNQQQTAKIIDLAINDEYILADVQTSTGNFIGRIKEEYEDTIKDIINKCTKPNFFTDTNTHLIIKYIKEKYNDDLEFLWEKYPNTGIWRNKQNNKWYALFMEISANKIGLNKEDLINILNLKYPKEEINKIIDNKTVFPGYHMNKNHWITINLDNVLEINHIYKLIDLSYRLTLNKK